MSPHHHHDRERRAGTHVVVAGGGFAGVGCATDLAKAGVRVTVVDRLTYHQFQPLLYQVATGQLVADDVARPLRAIFQRYENVDVKLGSIASIDPAQRSVTMADGTTYAGDHLVVALGSVVNHFGVPGASEHTFPLYSVHDAVHLRGRILEVLEAVDKRPERAQQGGLNFVIVGGGPTGVELAGSLAGLLERIVPVRYRDMPLDLARIHLVDVAPQLLTPFSDKAHAYAAKVLRDHGVELRLGTAVEQVTPEGVELSDGTSIASRCVVWAGGLTAPAVVKDSGLPLGRGGRVVVRADLGVDGFPGVHVAGDVAAAVGADGEVLPQLGSVALQAGRSTAANVVAEVDGREPQPFGYHDKGIMAMIGRKAAVAEFGAHRHEVEGPLGFAAWIGVHAWLMSGVRQRVDAFTSWMWDYFSSNRAPLIFDEGDAPSIDWGDESDEGPSFGDPLGPATAESGAVDGGAGA